jgi:hypothetical protein
VTNPEQDQSYIDLAKRGYTSADVVPDIMNFDPPSGPAPGAQAAPVESPTAPAADSENNG